LKEQAMHSEVSELFDLREKIALVTGGAKHLGFDAASILAAAGCRIAVTSRSAAGAAVAATELTQRYGVESTGLELDQTRFEDVARVMEAALKWKGAVDILVNNAGGGSGLSKAWLFDRDPADIASLMETNLTGMIYCCREIGRAMADRRSGRMINIASIAGMVGRDRRMYARSGMNGQPVDYAASKAGVIGLTRDLAATMAPFGVNVNAISPGGFARGQPETFIADYSDRTALGRMGRDGVDLKGAILFLASPASDYVTGHNLVVDGGFSIWH
jgi:NAD(P)-dependent dehydrogenase (short-subunit alcohol dehydrogenase family)